MLSPPVLTSNFCDLAPLLAGGIMADIARNRHTGGFAHILVDNLPVASRIPSPTCIRKHPDTRERAPLASLSVQGLGLALRGLSRHTGICWCPSSPNRSLGQDHTARFGYSDAVD
jgi:hypothetical protein